MVNVAALRLGLLFRVVSHRVKTGRWHELWQVLRNGSASTQIRATHFAAPGLLSPKGKRIQPPPLFQMASAYWISQAIYAAAKFGIADILKDGPKSCREIASAIKADEASLFRLMRVLCMLEVCRANDAGNFELIEFGRPLQSGVSGSLRAMVLTLGELHYQSWGHLCESVQTGHPGFERVYGGKMFEFLEKNSDAGETFNLAMTDFSAFVSYAVLLSYDFFGIKSIVDVGGGYGKLLTSILDVYPQMQGVLFDLPAVIDAANAQIDSLPCRDRCAAIAGNFLESLPRGADLYLLSGVIHDWDDRGAQLILRNCRNAMRSNGRVLVVECVVPDGSEPSFSKLLDLNMLVMTGGRERTAGEFLDLLSEAGLKLSRIIPTASPLSIIEAVCK
jgi:hypothetical protein